MKFPTLNIILSTILMIGMISCGQKTASKEEHGHHHEEGHDHDHGHSHKSASISLADGAYKVDVEKSYIKWTGKKVTGEHFGKLKLSSGSVNIKEGNITPESNFVVDMTTITVEDIPADQSMNKKLKGHLESPDFFNTSGHPETTFKVTSISKGDKEGMINVTGDLVIKGISNSITFPAHIMNHDGKIHAMADIVFDRTKYDIKYKSGSFFDDLGDKTIHDEVYLELHLYASM